MSDFISWSSARSLSNPGTRSNPGARFGIAPSSAIAQIMGGSSSSIAVHSQPIADPAVSRMQETVASLANVAADSHLDMHMSATENNLAMCALAWMAVLLVSLPFSFIFSF